MFDGQTAYNDVHREYTDEERAGPVVQRAAYRQLAAKLGDLAFLGFFALYTIAAIIWLLVGLLPFVAGEFPSLRATLQQWTSATGGIPSIQRFRRLIEIAISVRRESYNFEPPAQVILQYLFSLLNLVLGVYLIWLRPRNRAARLLSLGMIGTAAIFNLQAHTAEEVLPALGALHNPFHLIAGLAYIPALLLFPDGKLVPRMSRSRWSICPRRVLGLLLLVFLGLPRPT